MSHVVLRRGDCFFEILLRVRVTPLLNVELAQRCISRCEVRIECDGMFEETLGIIRTANVQQ